MIPTLALLDKDTDDWSRLGGDREGWYIKDDPYTRRFLTAAAAFKAMDELQAAPDKRGKR